jgi:hypothetical protein
MKRTMKEHGIIFQLTPAGMQPPSKHGRTSNPKVQEHFIAIMAGTDAAFPLYLWDMLLPQAEDKLNLLCQSRLHPKMSSYSHLNGPFDFNLTPLAPLGTKAIVHEKPNQHGT